MQNSERIWQLVDTRKDEYEALSDRIWEMPEIAYNEYNSVVEHTAMLESCFGRAAQTYPGPDRWAVRAAPFFLGLGTADNGKSLTVPGF